MIIFTNKATAKTLLLLTGVFVMTQQANAVTSALTIKVVKSEAAGINRNLKTGFSDVGKFINQMKGSIVEAVKKTHAEQIAAQKKISDVATKVQEDLNRAREQTVKSESFNESKKYASRQYGDDSIPGDICKQTAIGDTISNGGNKEEIVEQIKKDNQEIQDKKPEDYNKRKALYNQRVSDLPGKGKYLMSEVLKGQETISKDDAAKIASLLDHFIDNSEQNTFSEQDLGTVAGQVNQAKTNNLSMQKELLKSIFAEQLIYPKIEVIRSGDQSASTHSLMKNNVNNLFTKGFEPVITKNDVGILREIYKNQTVDNKIALDTLAVNKDILTILAFLLSHTIDEKMKDIKR